MKMNNLKDNMTDTIKITTSGTVIKAPERVKTATGKVMATMTIQAKSDKRSPYPLRLVAFDTDAISLMMCKRGDRVTAKGSYGWFNGYQLSGAKLIG